MGEIVSDASPFHVEDDGADNLQQFGRFVQLRHYVNILAHLSDNAQPKDTLREFFLNDLIQGV